MSRAATEHKVIATLRAAGRTSLSVEEVSVFADAFEQVEREATAVEMERCVGIADGLAQMLSILNDDGRLADPELVARAIVTLILKEPKHG